MQLVRDERREEPKSAGVLELLSRIGEDLKVIGKDEMALARIELGQLVKKTAIDAAAIILAGIVALIGLGLLCVAVVAAIAPVIPALWLRMLLMAGVYLASGATVSALFVKRLRRDLMPPLPKTLAEAKRTARSVKQELSHA